MRYRLMAVLKRLLVPVVYRFSPFGLEPERLGVYLNGLVDRAHLSGDVAEIGCSIGGTAVLASTALRRLGWTGTYICYDTFGVCAESVRCRCQGSEPPEIGRECSLTTQSTSCVPFCAFTAAKT